MSEVRTVIEPAVVQRSCSEHDKQHKKKTLSVEYFLLKPNMYHLQRGSDNTAVFFLTKV